MNLFEYNDPNKKINQACYITFMMLSSCFKKANCLSTLSEKKLFLFYKEMSEKTQIEWEEQIERAINEFIIPELNIENIENEIVDIHLKNEENLHTITVENSKFYFILNLSKVGNKLNMSVSGSSNGQDIFFECFCFLSKKEGEPLTTLNGRSFC